MAIRTAVVLCVALLVVAEAQPSSWNFRRRSLAQQALPDISDVVFQMVRHDASLGICTQGSPPVTCQAVPCMATARFGTCCKLCMGFSRHFWWRKTRVWATKHDDVHPARWL